MGIQASGFREVFTVAEANPGSQTRSQTKAQTEAKTGSQTRSQTKAKTEAKTGSQTGSKTKAKTKAGPQTHRCQPGNTQGGKKSGG